MDGRDWAVIGHVLMHTSPLRGRRAILTVAAIGWGTVTVVLLLSFGEGLARQIGRNTLSVGENFAVVRPGATSRAWNGLPAARPIRPRVGDVEAITRRLPDLAAVIGEMSARTALTQGTTTVQARVVGTSQTYGDVRKHFPRPGGRFFSAGDEDERRRVIFLGDTLARDLFGQEPPVGGTVRVAGVPYTVIGVMQSKTQSTGYGGLDAEHAVVPLPTYQAHFGGDRLSNLVVQVRRPQEMKGALRRVYEVLGERHGFDPRDERALDTWNAVRSSETNQAIVRGIEIFLGVIGLVTLAVAAVGVANVMYAAVKERTRVIGVHMALGARRRWVTGPLVLEGLIYTLVGGTGGMTLAVVVVALLQLVPTEGSRAAAFLGKPTLSWLVGLTTAIALGTAGGLAGYLPARRAAAVDPAVTLRYE
jgi:putative ABC transport system permease protein